MTDTRVPAFPHVLIIVTETAVMVDGEVVDRGSAGDPDTSIAIQLGVHAAARRVVQRLGRPVRATLRCQGEERRIIIAPDGSFADAEEAKPTPSRVVSVAAPGSILPPRRPARRPISAVFHVDRRRFATSLAYVGLGTVLITGLLLTGSDGDEPTQVAEGALEAPSTAGLSPHDIVMGHVLEPLPSVSGVVADLDVGGFRLQVTTSQAARVKVLASPQSGAGESRVWTIRTLGAATRTLAFDDLPAGSYRWVVRSSGEPARTGSVVVPPTAEPPPVVSDDGGSGPQPTPDTPQPPDNGGGDDSTLPGPTGPVDPDDPAGR